MYLYKLKWISWTTKRNSICAWPDPKNSACCWNFKILYTSFEVITGFLCPFNRRIRFFFLRLNFTLSYRWLRRLFKQLTSDKQGRAERKLLHVKMSSGATYAVRRTPYAVRRTPDSKTAEHAHWIWRPLEIQNGGQQITFFHVTGDQFTTAHMSSRRVFWSNFELNSFTVRQASSDGNRMSFTWMFSPLFCWL